MGGFNRPQKDPDPKKYWTRKVPRKLIDNFNDALGLLQDGDYDKLKVETIYEEE